MALYPTQDDLNTLATRMQEIGETYEVRNGIAYIDGVDVGSVTYLASRRLDQFVDSLNAALRQKKEQ